GNNARRVTSFLVSQPAARVGRAGYIYRGAALFDKCNLPFFIDHERSAVGDTPFRHQNTIVLGRLSRRKIAQEWEGKGQLFGKFTQGRNIIGADPEDLRVSAFELLDTSLVSGEFFGSASGKCGLEESDDRVRPAAGVGEFHLRGLGRLQLEVGRHVADLEMSLGRRSRLSKQPACQRRRQHCQTDSLHIKARVTQTWWEKRP